MARKAPKKAAKQKPAPAAKPQPATFTSRVKKLMTRTGVQLNDHPNTKATRFKPGNPGGPGNPLGGRAEQLRSILLESADPDTIRRAWLMCQLQAAEGSVEHQRLLFNYIWPRDVNINVTTKQEFDSRMMVVIQGAARSMVEEAKTAQETIRQMMEHQRAGTDDQVQPAQLPR